MLVAMAPMVSILKDAGRVPQNLVATLQPAGRWLPSPRQPRVKQLTIRRPMIPDGDRRHSPESGCVVNEVPSLVRNENVMSVLVLGEDALHCQRWAKGASPVERSFERSLFRDGARQSIPQGGGEARIVDQRNVTHRLSPVSILVGRLTNSMPSHRMLRTDLSCKIIRSASPGVAVA